MCKCVCMLHTSMLWNVWKLKDNFWGTILSSRILGTKSGYQVCVASALIAKPSCQPKSCILKNVTLFLCVARSYAMSMY